MGELRRFFLRLLRSFSSARAERELERELAAHLGLLEERYQQEGMGAAEARSAARRALAALHATEAHREARAFGWVEDARRDVRYALRGLARDRGFAAAALLTLAIGIGATTLLFGGLNAVLLRPLPVPEPERLVFVSEAFGTRGAQRAGVTAPDFVDWRRQQGVFTAMAASAPTPLTLAGAGEPESLPALRVSADYLRVLGLRPARGRDFAPADDVFGAPRTVLVSDGFWRERFAADPALVGRTLSLNGEPHTVIGILPAGAGLAERSEPLFVPLALTPREQASTGNRFLRVSARLAPGVTHARAQAEMTAIAARIAETRPHSNTGVTARVEDAREVLVGELRRPLTFFLAAAGFLLLLACANVANLQLVRSFARRREVAIRAALGAGRGRLVRQLTIEGLVLAGLGGGAGLALAALSADLVPWLIPGVDARWAGDLLDARVIGATAGLSLGSGILFGLVPAFRLTRAPLRAELHASPRGATLAGGPRTGGAFAVAQIAVALLLLVGAALSLRSFVRLQAVDPGFRASNLLTFRVALPEIRYGAPGATEAFHARLVDAIAALPGVTAAAGTSALPLRGRGQGVSAPIEGRAYGPGGSGAPFLLYRGVTPGYFRTLGVPVLRGRGLGSDDRPGTTRVAVINQTAARQIWPGGDPIGARLKPDDSAGPVEIVGVVADTKHLGLHVPVQPELSIALAQISPSLWRWNRRTFDLVVRTAAAPATVAASVRETVRRLDPGLPVIELATMEDVVAGSMAAPRRAMLLLLAAGLIALVLAALGIYGVMAFLVAGRQQEIGVRVALGATRTRILALVLGQSVRFSALGLALGLAAALALSRFMATFLFGVTATDAASYAAIALLLFVVAQAAAYLPARRALAVDPVRALRAD